MEPKQPLKIEQEGETYSIVRINGVRGIQCDRCQRVSYSPSDIEHRYCAHCHIFHDEVARERELRALGKALDGDDGGDGPARPA